MRRLFLFSLLAIVAALWVTLYLGFPADPGYLLIAFGDYTFETSLLALMVALGVIYLFIKLLLLMIHWINPWRWARLGKDLAHRSRSKHGSRTVEGLLYLTRQNWSSAYNVLSRSVNDDDASVINYLAAAWAAYEMDDRDKWTHCLNRAEQEYPAAHSTINFLRARLLYRTGQLEQSLAILEMLKNTAINDRPLLAQLKKVYFELEDWQGLNGLLPLLEDNDMVSEEEIALIEKRILLENLMNIAARAGRDIDRAQALSEMRKLWKKAKRSHKSDANLLRAYADLLLNLEAPELAAKVLQRGLERTWNEDLILLYGERDYGVSSEQLLIAEQWLQSRPADAALLITLGRLAMRNELWGKAREYFEASLKVAPSAEAYGELSRLLEALGEHQAGEDYRRQYEKQLGSELPSLPMPDPQLQGKGVHSRVEAPQ